MSLYQITNKERAENFVRNFWKKEDPKLVTSLVEMAKREFSKSRPFHTFYEEGKVEGVDYVVCPLLGFRRVRLDARYTKSVGFTNYSDYETLFPGTPKAASSLAKNIASGLNEVDPETGLTKYEMSQVAARETLLTVGEDGLTGVQRRGLKTQAGLLEKTQDGRSVAAVAAQARNDIVMEDGRTLQQHALAKARVTMEKTGSFGGRGASNKSKEVLEPILSWLDENRIPYHFDDSEYYQSYWVPANPDEFTPNTIDKMRVVAQHTKVYRTKDEATKACMQGQVAESRWFFYDLTIPLLSANIEFNGISFHPSIHERETWPTWQLTRKGATILAEDVAAYDKIKQDYLKENTGFSTWNIWENYEYVDRCLDYLKEKHNELTNNAG